MGLAPDIIKLIAGDKTGQFANQVGKAVADTVGTTNAGEAQTKLAAKVRHRSGASTETR